MREESVVLVDTEDNEVGIAPKLEAHRRGLLHRAVSVFVFNSRGETLLQRRASRKYHSAGLWSNTACSHPRPGETPHAAAKRRLREEMGVRCSPRYAFRFLYRAELDRGLIEHELDHVFVGTSDAGPEPDPSEVEEWRWIGVAQLREELAAGPHRFTAWLPIAWKILTENDAAGSGAPGSRLPAGPS